MRLDTPATWPQINLNLLVIRGLQILFPGLPHWTSIISVTLRPLDSEEERKDQGRTDLTVEEAH